MAKYKLLEMAYINNTLLNAGAIVTVPDGTIPGPHMQPVDETAKRAFAKAGVKNCDIPNYIDDMTGLVDVTAFGASPQGIKAGIAMDAHVEGAMGPEHLEPL